jgi:type I restriction enzyme S subunit
LLYTMYASFGVPTINQIAVATNQAIIAFLPKPDSVAVDYLYYYLWSIKPRLEERTRGTTQANLSKGIVEKLKVPLPPLPEQHRIVEKVEELFTKLDAGVNYMGAAKVLLERYRQSILTYAVTGQLSKPWRDAQAQRSGRSERHEMRPQAGPFQVPTTWSIVPFGQLLSEPLTNGLSVKGSNTPPGIAALKLSAMQDHGFDYSDVRYLPIDEARARRLAVQEGDFYISRGNGTLALMGRGTLAQKPPGLVIFPDTMIRARLAQSVYDSIWVPTVWQSRFIRNQLEAKAKTTAGIHKVSQADISSISVPLPPHEEQEVIVKTVRRLLSVASHVELALEEELVRCQRLRQTILSKAFSGNLAAQQAVELGR